MARFEFQPKLPQDWEAYREEIARYYINEGCTLDELQATMLQRHGFNATRQYCSKLKQWNLRKNISASDKDQIIDRIVAARLLGHTIAEVRLDDRPVDLKSLLKHAQAQIPSSDVGSIAEKVQILHRTLAGRGQKRPAAADVLADNIQIIYQDRDMPKSDSLHSDFDQDEWTIVAMSPATSSPQHRLQNASEGFDTPPIQPSLAHAPTLGLEKIIRLSREYMLAALESRIQMSPLQPHEVHMLSRSPDSESAAMRTFWVDAKNAFYVAKKHERDLTFNFASRACAAIQAPTSVETSLGTLKDVLATLSPANTNACLALRDRLLDYLSQILGMRFGTQHPLALLCSELRQETGDAEVYETALQFAIECMQSEQSTHPCDVISFRRELIRLLRRSGHLYRAEELCVEQEAYCVRHFGNDAPITRRATSDRVHVLMAKQELELAMAACEDLVERSRRHLGQAFPDELAVHALEDLAELCELHGSPGRCLFLVHEAYFGAVRLWGAQASSTEYILSKIQAASKCATPTLCSQHAGRS